MNAQIAVSLARINPIAK